jgi:hypothetical protein
MRSVTEQAGVDLAPMRWLNRNGRMVAVGVVAGYPLAGLPHDDDWSVPEVAVVRDLQR